MISKIAIIATASILLILFGYLLGKRGELRRAIVWKKTKDELLIRPEESLNLLYASTNDTENRLAYELHKKVYFVRKGKEIKIFFSEDEVLALLGDATPVVRCGECMWCVGDCVCVHPDNRNPIGCRKNDFCNEGKRRNENQAY